MAKRVGINGFGRIGRNFYRAYLHRDPGFEIVAVNDLAAPDVLGHLLRYDSTHGKLHQEIEISDGVISVDGSTFRVLAERDPSALPWRDMEVDVVVESTGLFTNREGASQHLTAGADKVVISAPATDPDLTIVSASTTTPTTRRSTTSSPTPRARPTRSGRWPRSCATTSGSLRGS